MAVPTNGQWSKRERRRRCSKLAVFLIGRLRMVMRHGCDVGYLDSVPSVRGGSGMSRELRWPVKYDQSH